MRFQRCSVYPSLGNPQKWNGSPIDSEVRSRPKTYAGKSLNADMNRQGQGDSWLSA